MLPTVPFTGKETRRSSERAKTTAGRKKPQPVSNCSVKKAFNTARTKQILSFPRKMPPLPCTWQGAGPTVGLPQGRDLVPGHFLSSHEGRQSPGIHTSRVHGCPSPHPPLHSLFPLKFSPGRRPHTSAQGGLAMGTELPPAAGMKAARCHWRLPFTPGSVPPTHSPSTGQGDSTAPSQDKNLAEAFL